MNSTQAKYYGANAQASDAQKKLRTTRKFDLTETCQANRIQFASFSETGHRMHKISLVLLLIHCLRFCFEGSIEIQDKTYKKENATPTTITRKNCVKMVVCEAKYVTRKRRKDKKKQEALKRIGTIEIIFRINCVFGIVEFTHTHTIHGMEVVSCYYFF